jgi:formylglycine-generating enzyme required for sulfatase activity
MKKPNDFGLFDVQGNCYTWCQESYKDYPKEQLAEPSEDKEDILDTHSTRGGVLRGGSFGNQASFVRSANRSGGAPADRVNIVGFRPARTFTP